MPAIRRALSRGRTIGPRDGDRAASLSHRRAAPHRRLRCGAPPHLSPFAGVAGDGVRDPATLPRADKTNRREIMNPSPCTVLRSLILGAATPIAPDAQAA